MEAGYYGWNIRKIKLKVFKFSIYQTKKLQKYNNLEVNMSLFHMQNYAIIGLYMLKIIQLLKYSLNKNK